MPGTNLQNRSGNRDERLDDMRPYPLDSKEWAELLTIPEIREAWGVEDDETPADFAAMVYAAKFHFHSGSPGYVGDLYILQDDVTGDKPLVLGRDKKGTLIFMA